MIYIDVKQSVMLKVLNLSSISHVGASAKETGTFICNATLDELSFAE